MFRVYNLSKFPSSSAPTKIQFLPVLSVPCTSGQAWYLNDNLESSVHESILDTGFPHSPFPLKNKRIQHWLKTHKSPFKITTKKIKNFNLLISVNSNSIDRFIWKETTKRNH